MTSSTAARSVRDRLIDAAEVLPARQGNSRHDGVRGRRGRSGVARLAVPALPGQGVAARCGDRAAQRGVLVGGARDARTPRGSRSADRLRRGARPNRLRRSGRAADAAADGGTRGVRRRAPGPACRGWCRIWRTSGGRYLVAARDRGEIHPDIDIAEASEWVARVIISLVTVPGDILDPAIRTRVRAHVRRYVDAGA